MNLLLIILTILKSIGLLNCRIFIFRTDVTAIDCPLARKFERVRIC